MKTITLDYVIMIKTVLPRKEHAAVASALINYAVQNKKQVYILSPDLRDTFGSISQL
jgi:hypothetical protein